MTPSKPRAVRPAGRLRRLRARLVTPHLREVDPQRRGFLPWAEGPSIVEPVGGSFLAGFRLAMEHGPAVDVVRALQGVEVGWRGFAAEGAGMAVAIRAALEPWRRGEFHRLVSVSGGRHTYMMHVGLGWALARLPRPLWPALGDVDPAVGPLVLDGYGFHEVFFHTRRVLDAHTVPFPLDRWPGPAALGEQALMQGVGRGLWFVAGGSPATVAELVAGFDDRFAASLWAGVGLAATYAGGRDADALRELLVSAGPHRRWVRQGCAFAVEARERAATTNAHTAVAARALCDATVQELVAVVAEHRPTPHEVDGGDWTAYTRWREQIAADLDQRPVPSPPSLVGAATP